MVSVRNGGNRSILHCRVYSRRLAHIPHILPLWRNEVESYIISSFLDSLEFASRGQIVLTPGQYYQAIDKEMESVKAPHKIVAVATLSSQFWRDDREQRRYIASNLLEAARRDVDIAKRVFIVVGTKTGRV